MDARTLLGLSLGIGGLVVVLLVLWEGVELSARVSPGLSFLAAFFFYLKRVDESVERLGASSISFGLVGFAIATVFALFSNEGKRRGGRSLCLRWNSFRQCEWAGSAGLSLFVNLKE